ncbi:cytochrome P450 [Sporichthya sp.]|uniref:cytochrome P450 n=1 Tax=Sporichthya sp. TaxID=65475 RepID=UPI0017FCF1EB|nr:cytochrome P450 [Sporichthya sp.]MBA3741461.1 cytochrome P450 [Sporichthya sp.]
MATTSFGPGPRVVDQPFFTSSPFEPTRPPVERIEDVDLTDPTLYLDGDPHATWKVLRDTAPIFWHEKGTLGTRGQGFWVATRHAEFVQVTKTESRIFSNAETPLLDMTGEMFGDQISVMDAPRHLAYRRIIQRYFTPKATIEWQDEVRRIVDDILDEICEKGECDFAEIALKIPVPATGALMRLTASECAQLQPVQEALHLADTPEALMQYSQAGLGLFTQIVNDRRANPRADFIGAILAAEPEGEALSDEQVLMYLWILFIGGLDSTVHAMSASLLTLFHHPDQFARLKADPGLMPTAVQEMLRWTAVSQHLKRLATEDTVVAGQQVKAGEFVVVFDPSANRDERVFPEPFRFDVGRSPGPICTFGMGPHVCPGLHFAALEMEALFGAVVKRMPDIRQAGPAERALAFSILLPPIKHLPVSFTPSKKVER